MLASVLVSLYSYSQTTCTSNGGNNWASAFNCSGSGSPVVYIIQAGDSVHCDVNSTTAIDSLKIYGILTFKNGSKIDLIDTGIIQVFTGARVFGGNSGSKFRFASGITISGVFDVSGPAYAQNTSTFTTGTVPVSWLYFKVGERNSKLSFSWATATEINNAGFELQYSLDGNEFVAIDWIYSKHSSGNSNEITEYHHDIDPVQYGITPILFFRLKQLDFDGSFSFTDVISYRGTAKEELAYQVINKQLHLSNSSTESMKYTLFDPLGRVIHSSNLESSAVLNLSSKGLYTLLVSRRSELTSYKIVFN